MKRIRNRFFITISILVAALPLLLYIRDSDTSNDYKCRTKKNALRGVIAAVYDGHEYSKIKVMDSIYGLAVDEVKYCKGYSVYHYYGEGDSIIKAANSKEVTIKRGDSICIFVLSCDDFSLFPESK